MIDIVNMEKESLCVIVGGGIAGLSAADVLKKNGIRFVKSLSQVNTCTAHLNKYKTYVQ